MRNRIPKALAEAETARERGRSMSLRTTRNGEKAGAPIAVPHRVLLVAPSPPPYGGMALQARLLERLLGADGHRVVFLPSNLRFPPRLGFLERIPGVRTALRVPLIWIHLRAQVKQIEV